MRLRDISLDNDGGPHLAQIDHSTESSNIKAVFDNHVPELVKLIGRYQFGVGCVAWLTNAEILRALANVSAQIVVQKEDFLRPDAKDVRWKTDLRKSYERLHCDVTRFEMPGVLSGMSFCSDPSVQGVRCMGEYSKGSVHPRMHHKFLVVGDLVDGDERTLIPRAVWTGSFNFTYNAANSLENAVVIEDTNIALAYFYEWAQVLAMSEPLDWSAEYVAPEWRVGS